MGGNPLLAEVLSEDQVVLAVADMIRDVIPGMNVLALQKAWSYSTGRAHQLLDLLKEVGTSDYMSEDAEEQLRRWALMELRVSVVGLAAAGYGLQAQGIDPAVDAG